MGLMGKVRVLLGALAHKPFSPRQERTEFDEAEPPGADRARPPADGSQELQKAEVDDQERVADLIVREKRDAAG